LDNSTHNANSLDPPSVICIDKAAIESSDDEQVAENSGKNMARVDTRQVSPKYKPGEQLTGKSADYPATPHSPVDKRQHFGKEQFGQRQPREQIAATCTNDQQKQDGKENGENVSNKRRIGRFTDVSGLGVVARRWFVGVVRLN